MTCDLHSYELVDGGICPECTRLANQAEARLRRAERRSVRERISPTPRDPDEIELGYHELFGRLHNLERYIDEWNFDIQALQRAADDGRGGP